MNDHSVDIEVSGIVYQCLYSHMGRKSSENTHPAIGIRLEPSLNAFSPKMMATTHFKWNLRLGIVCFCANFAATLILLQVLHIGGPQFFQPFFQERVARSKQEPVTPWTAYIRAELRFILFETVLDTASMETTMAWKFDELIICCSWLESFPRLSTAITDTSCCISL